MVISHLVVFIRNNQNRWNRSIVEPRQSHFDLVVPYILVLIAIVFASYRNLPKAYDQDTVLPPINR